MISKNWSAIFSDKRAMSWALYDWANSAFATTVMAGFFPVFFKGYWSFGTDANTSTYYLGVSNAIAGLVLALTAPAFGALTDLTSMKKAFLLLFAALGIVTTGALYFVGQGDWQFAAVLYILATIGFTSSNTFYDALMLSVSNERTMQRVSALGFSLGYLGGGVLFALNVFMVLKPDVFGIPDDKTAVRLSFLMVAAWWTFFSLPLIFFVREERRPWPGLKVVARGFAVAIETARHLKSNKMAATFLLAYFLYIDGVNTIMKMAVDYGLALGFPSQSLIVALLLTQFVGFPSALAFGSLSHRWSEKACLQFAIIVYAGVTLFAVFMQETWHFYFLAVAIGLVQGGIQAISRSMFGKLIPEKREAEFFGFYNMLGKFSSMIGPLLVGWVSLVTGSARFSILSVLILFIGGSVILTRVKTEPAHQTA